METKVIATLIDGRTLAGRLTTDHAASSYGQPVFVDEAGNAYDRIAIVRTADAATYWQVRAQDLEHALCRIYEQATNDGQSPHVRLGYIESAAARAVGGDLATTQTAREAERVAHIATWRNADPGAAQAERAEPDARD